MKKNSKEVFYEIKENIELLGKVLLSLGYRNEWFIIKKGNGVYETYERDSFDRWCKEPSYVGRMMDTARYIYHCESDMGVITFAELVNGKEN